MKKPKANQRKLNQKRAKKAARRKIIVNEKKRVQREREARLDQMDEEELREFLGEDYDDGDECDHDHHDH